MSSDTELREQPSLEDVRAFLCGERPLLGRWYGESSPAYPMFWWRKYLTEAIHSRERALLAEIRADLPESIYSKLDKCPYCGISHQYACTCDTGFDAAITDVAAILTKYESEMK